MATPPDANQLRVVYCFVADGIQGYIMDRANLREMVGASAIIAAVSDVSNAGPLQRLLEALQIAGAVFGRRGGGGFTVGLATEEQGKQLLLHWALIVEQLAPGLSFAHATGAGDTLHSAWLSATRSIARQKRQPMLHLPPGTVVVARSRRTGQSVDFSTGANALDRVMQRKRGAAVVAGNSDKDGRNGRVDAVAARLVALGQGHFDNWRWPRDHDYELEPSSDPDGDERIYFPYRQGAAGEMERDLAVVHFDGNGFGGLAEALKQLKGDDASQILEREAALSALMDDLCMTAMVSALKQVIQPEQDQRVPVRPLILAGEDVTLIIRADLALPFALAFTEAFESAASEKGKGDLTVSGGVAIVKAGFPFDMAYHQAEQLCERAKRTSRECGQALGLSVPSTLAFSRVTGALASDAAAKPDGNRAPLVYLSGGWKLGDSPLPRLAAFTDLARFAGADPPLRSACRRLVGVWQHGQAEHLAQDEYQRMLKNLKDRKADRGVQDWSEKLNALVGSGTLQTDLPIISPNTPGGVPFSPLHDLVAWLAVAGVDDGGTS